MHDNFGQLIDDDVADDPKDLGSRVDIGVLGGHLRCAQAIAGLVEHGPDGSAQGLRRWLVGCQIDTDAGPCDARIDAGLVFRQPGRTSGIPKLMAWLTLP